MKKIIQLVKDKISRVLFKYGSSQYRIKYLLRQGAKIGPDCLILSEDFGTEPYLIEIGRHVAIASGARFINHDGSVWLLREQYPELNVFGQIRIGDNTLIGMNCLLLPGTEIGANCIIGAGSVVRGKIADNSVVMGNPAKIIMKTSFIERSILSNKNRVDNKNMTETQKKEVLLKHFYQQ